MTRVVRFHEYGPADVLRIDDIEVRAPAADEVQIAVRAIGLNRAEVMFRNGAYLQDAEFPSLRPLVHVRRALGGRREIPARAKRNVLISGAMAE